MLKHAIYARKSTESEDRQVLSIDSQIKELRTHASRAGLPIERVLVESKSAKAPGRPVFGELLSLVQKSEIDSILCWKLDRLARNPVDGGAIVWSLEENKLKKIITPQRDFVNSGNDKFWMQLEFGMAKKYIDDLRDNVMRGMRAKLERGWYPYLPPIGYLNEPVERTIVRDPERFILVRKMWELMLTGNYSPPGILRIATDQWGLRTRQHKRSGGNPLGRSAIYRIFSNPFYYGAMFADGNWYTGRHEPMVSRVEFDRVQKLLGRTDRSRPQKHHFAFTGLIRCGQCGAAVTAEHRTNRFGSEYIYYHCTRKKKGVTCTEKYLNATELEIQILGFLHSIRLSANHLKWALDALDELASESQEKSKSVLVSLQKQQERCKRNLELLLNLRLRNLISDEEYVGKKKELQSELTRLEAEIAAYDGQEELIARRCEQTFRFAEQAEDAFISGDDSLRRAILSCVGSNLTLKGKKLLIQAQKPFEILRTRVNGPGSENGTFEPEKNGEDSRKTRTALTRSLDWWSIVDDVRTWMDNNSDESWLAPFIRLSSIQKISNS